MSFAGGTVGLVLAAWGHRLLLAFMIRDPQSVALDFRLDYRVLCFCLVLSVVTCMLFGLIPCLRATRSDLIGPMRMARRGPGGRSFAKVLVPVQVALSMVLLIVAGLFARSLTNLGTADLGLVRDDLLLMDLRSSERLHQNHQQFSIGLSERLSALPGVQSTALAGDAVFGNGGWSQTLWIQRAAQPDRNVNVSHNVVSPGFFATVEIPVLIGREFDEHDHHGSPLVAVVNQTFVRRCFGNQDPIGKRFGDRGQGSSGRYEIVGVVGDAKYGAVREDTRPMVFYPLPQQESRNSLVVHVRTASPPEALIPAIRGEVLAIDDEALVSEVRTLPQVIRSQLRQERMLATLATLFAGLALALAGVGLYGVVAYKVGYRTQEIGVRLALGAQRTSVLWFVMRETVALLAVGAVVGAAGIGGKPAGEEHALPC